MVGGDNGVSGREKEIDGRRQGGGESLWTTFGKTLVTTPFLLSSPSIPTTLTYPPTLGRGHPSLSIETDRHSDRQAWSNSCPRHSHLFSSVPSRATVKPTTFAPQPPFNVPRPLPTPLARYFGGGATRSLLKLPNPQHGDEQDPRRLCGAPERRDLRVASWPGVCSLPQSARSLTMLTTIAVPNMLTNGMTDGNGENGTTMWLTP
jgi:hypothetical protein